MCFRTRCSRLAAGMETGEIRSIANPCTERHSPALPYAAASGSVTAVKLLLECVNVDRNSKDNEGRTPLQWASHSWKALKLLSVCENIDISSKDNSGRAPLSKAADRRQELSVELLLDRQQIHADSKDNTGLTALS